MSIVVKIHYKIILICCCNCCAQTSTFQFFFIWSEFWNQICGVSCSGTVNKRHKF